MEIQFITPVFTFQNLGYKEPNVPSRSMMLLLTQVMAESCNLDTEHILVINPQLRLLLLQCLH